MKTQNLITWGLLVVIIYELSKGAGCACGESGGAGGSGGGPGGNGCYPAGGGKSANGYFPWVSKLGATIQAEQKAAAQ